MLHFLGIDVGSSKTHALIVDESGRCIGFGSASGGNPQTVGISGLESALADSVSQACDRASLPINRISGAGFGIAGYDFPTERDAYLAAVNSLGLKCQVEIANDGVLGLLAGTPRGVGVNVTAGSGVNCRGRGPDGKQGRIVGNGAAFGEFGGGIEIAMKGLHIVNYAWIKRIPPTSLTAIYLEFMGASDELDLMEGLSNERYQLAPALATKVFEAAFAGDDAAGDVIRWAGRELGWLAVSVIRQIGMENQAVNVVLSGSIFEGGDLIIEPMRELIIQYCPEARLTRLAYPPVIGAVLLGMANAQKPLAADFRQKVFDTFPAF